MHMHRYSFCNSFQKLGRVVSTRDGLGHQHVAIFHAKKTSIHEILIATYIVCIPKVPFYIWCDVSIILCTFVVKGLLRNLYTSTCYYKVTTQ
jgi:hypothetical protein